MAPLHAEYTASTVIVVGMELEDQQYVDFSVFLVHYST